MNISIDQIKAIGAMVATVLTGAIVIWWLVIVAQKLGMKPEVKNGSVILDEYGRSKDILLVVLPLFSAALAYWVGSSGTQDAKKDAAGAKEEAAGAKEKLNAVIDMAPEGTLQRAKETHPQAWGAT